ncbi:unnamed protein product [Nippostrongylus brasiliensis]|uniref:Serine/arginine repetitive matrix protein 1 n=1 Tax=Nippostrongylus brasiliensis TaxID=27835 RepID=A0A158QYN9_NIPBR|nr:unnamed protein product [Nippostrongylus brasiliensis]
MKSLGLGEAGDRVQVTMRPPPSGHMVINMKTTITTHGAHNGVVVHAGVQSGAGTSQANQWYVPSRFPQIETPGGSRMQAVAPGTSQENLATNSPPDEFIQPTKVTLNVFNPGRSDPIPYETSLRRAATNENFDALINDTVTTTTTVEVFRTPLDPSNPDRVVVLPPPPVPSVDDRPQLLRVNGPGYEQWSGHRTETLINDRPIHAATPNGKAVQWKETLVEDAQRGLKKVTVYDPYSGQRSPYANAATSPQPPRSHQYQLPTVNSFNERLIPHPSTNKNVYTVHSPSEFSQVSHPVITSSNEDLSRSPYPRSPVPTAPPNGYRELVTHPAIPDTSGYRSRTETPILSQSSSHGGYEQVRRPPTSAVTPAPRTFHPIESNVVTRSLSSPLYVEPVRDRGNARSSIPLPEPRRRSRRARSSYRKRTDPDPDRYQRRRSESPTQRRHSSPQYSTLQPGTVSPGGYMPRTDPNRLPGEGPQRANSREIFNLYQTRDVLQNVVAQFTGLSTLITIFAGREIKAALLAYLNTWLLTAPDDLANATEKAIPQCPRALPNVKPKLPSSTVHIITEDFYEELEHIYEEIDNYRVKTLESPERSESTSTLKKEDFAEEPTYVELAAIESLESSGASDEDEEMPEELNEFKALVASLPPKSDARRAHPDGLVFPRITTAVCALPEVPEELEILSQSSESQNPGIPLVDIPFADESRTVSPSDLSCDKDVSKKASIRHRAEVRAEQHKLVIQGWESLVSDSGEEF